MNLSKDSKKHAGFFIKRFLSFYSVNTLLTILSKYKNFKLSQLIFNFKNLKSSIALALFPTIYQLLKLIIPNHVPVKYKNNRLVTHFVAGGMASICLYLDPNQSRISSLYTMIIVRTLHFFIRALVFKPNTVKSINQNDTENKLILRPFQSNKVKYIQNVVSKWGDWIVWLYVAYQICYMVVLQPNYLSKSYVKSLNVVMNQRSKYGDDFLDIIDGLQALILYLVNQEPSNPLNWIPAHKSSKQHLTDLMEKSDVTDLVKKLRSLLEIFPDNVHHERLVCACSHPKHSSCVLGAADQGLMVFKQMLKPYLFLNSVSLIFKLLKKLYKHRMNKSEEEKTTNHTELTNKQMVVKWLTDSLRSVTMISSFCAVGAYSICALRHTFGRELMVTYGLSGCLATPTILLDKPGRLLELNNYGMGKIIESWCLILHDKVGLQYSRPLEVSVMIPVFGVLATLLEDFSYTPTGFVTPILYSYYGINKL